MDAPNAVWTIDFKGQFRLGTGAYCYPLTIMDGWSRYLLGCEALRTPTHEQTRRVLTRVFDCYGLPAVIRSDNGPPFAAPALGRLSRLAVWWIRLGIRPELIEPGQPQQNGRHERFHRTLKADTAQPPAATAGAQQRRFQRFRREYNHVRPHEALAQQCPADRYVASARRVPARVPLVDYPAHFEVRRIALAGFHRSQAGAADFAGRHLHADRPAEVLLERALELVDVAALGEVGLRLRHHQLEARAFAVLELGVARQLPRSAAHRKLLHELRPAGGRLAGRLRFACRRQ